MSSFLSQMDALTIGTFIGSIVPTMILKEVVGRFPCTFPTLIFLLGFTDSFTVIHYSLERASKTSFIANL